MYFQSDVHISVYSDQKYTTQHFCFSQVETGCKTFPMHTKDLFSSHVVHEWIKSVLLSTFTKIIHIHMTGDMLVRQYGYCTGVLWTGPNKRPLHICRQGPPKWTQTVSSLTVSCVVGVVVLWRDKKCPHLRRHVFVYINFPIIGPLIYRFENTALYALKFIFWKWISSFEDIFGVSPCVCQGPLSQSRTLCCDPILPYPYSLHSIFS